MLTDDVVVVIAALAWRADRLLKLFESLCGIVGGLDGVGKRVDLST
jgi:hypothetical protein